MHEGFKMKIQFYVPGNNFFPCLYAHINTIYTPLYISERFLLRASLYLSANKIAKSTSTYTRSLATTSICIITRLIFDQASALISNCQQNRSAEINSFPTALPPSAPKKKEQTRARRNGQRKNLLTTALPAIHTHTHTHTQAYTLHTHIYRYERRESRRAFHRELWSLIELTNYRTCPTVNQSRRAASSHAHSLSLSLLRALSRSRSEVPPVLIDGSIKYRMEYALSLSFS